MQVSDGADLRHALGLLLVRAQRYDAAVIELGRAVRAAGRGALCLCLRRGLA